MCTLQRLKIWPAVQMQALSVTDTLYNLRRGSDGCLFQLRVLQELELGPWTLTLYLLSPICSTWNRFAHLHLATCLVTCQKRRRNIHFNLGMSEWDPKNWWAGSMAAPTPCGTHEHSDDRGCVPHLQFCRHLWWACRHLCLDAELPQIHSSRCIRRHLGQRYLLQRSSPGDSLGTLKCTQQRWLGSSLTTPHDIADCLFLFLMWLVRAIEQLKKSHPICSIINQQYIIQIYLQEEGWGDGGIHSG